MGSEGSLSLGNGRLGEAVEPAALGGALVFTALSVAHSKYCPYLQDGQHHPVNAIPEGIFRGTWKRIYIFSGVVRERRETRREIFNMFTCVSGADKSRSDQPYNGLLVIESDSRSRLDTKHTRHPNNFPLQT